MSNLKNTRYTPRSQKQTSELGAPMFPSISRFNVCFPPVWLKSGWWGKQVCQLETPLRVETPSQNEASEPHT